MSHPARLRARLLALLFIAFLPRLALNGYAAVEYHGTAGVEAKVAACRCGPLAAFFPRVKPDFPLEGYRKDAAAIKHIANDCLKNLAACSATMAQDEMPEVMAATAIEVPALESQ